MKGGVTIFVSLLFISVLSLAAVIWKKIDSQRVIIYQKADVNRALFSVFAGYSKSLWEKYNIYALSSEKENEQLQDEEYIRQIKKYSTNHDNTRIIKKEYLTDYNGFAFLEQAIRHAKRRNKIDQERKHLVIERWEEQVDKGKRIWEHLQKGNVLDNLLCEICEFKEKYLQLGKNNKNYKGIRENAKDKRWKCKKLSDIDKTAFAKYALEKFDSFDTLTKKHDKKISSCELEYMVSGQSNAQKNVEKVIEIIMFFRLAENFDFIQEKNMNQEQAKDERDNEQKTKRSESAKAKEAIVKEQAYKKSIVDIRSLIRGEKLVKDERMQNGSNMYEKEDYKIYLGNIIYLTDAEKMSLRALKIIEENIENEGNEDFKADKSVVEIDVKTVLNGKKNREEFITSFRY